MSKTCHDVNIGIMTAKRRSDVMHKLSYTPVYRAQFFFWDSLVLWASGLKLLLDLNPAVPVLKTGTVNERQKAFAIILLQPLFCCGVVEFLITVNFRYKYFDM